MNVHRPRGRAVEEVRDDFIPASDFFSREFAEMENELLWPRVWQMACREEDIPKVGDYFTYDIVDDSIIVIRTAPDEIKAYHNSCPHRGRRLTEGCGHTARFHCRFHGWQFGLDGAPLAVVDREDWGDRLKDEDISLMPVKTGRWGGWVYINMDPACEPLETFLEPAKAILDPFQLDKQRYHFSKSAIVPCNWKTILGMFNEAYHLQQTHRQMLRYFDDITTSHAHGRHSMFEYWDAIPPGLPSRRISDDPYAADVRAGLFDYIQDQIETLQCAFPMLMGDAAKRLMNEPEGIDPLEAAGKLMQFTYEDAAARGVEIPQVTPEQMQQAGVDWHIFPNHILIMAPLATLTYRARPNGHDPESAIWDVYSLLRYPPGEEPKIEHQVCNDLTDEEAWPKILRQDFENIEAFQKGMKSRGFRGARPSPKQEIAVSNLHRSIREFTGV